jgi:hypothetical protein
MTSLFSDLPQAIDNTNMVSGKDQTAQTGTGYIVASL